MVFLLYIMCVQFFFVIERTRDLIYLKFVATDYPSNVVLFQLHGGGGGGVHGQLATALSARNFK